MSIDDWMPSEWGRERAEFPEWENATKVHDWRNHVPDRVQAIWKSFTAEQRLELFKWADDLAGMEEWE